ncbi:MAG: NAD(P)H-dependent oxidoreductase [Pseudomonadota bacterium]
MTKSICVLDGHPDPAPERLGHALADAYAEGAEAAGHAVDKIRVCDLPIACLESVSDFAAPPPQPLLSAREQIAEADHVAIFFPLWLGGMPAKLRAFFEHAARAAFFIGEAEKEGSWPKKLMKGKSARTVVTMGMPPGVYKLFFDAGGLKALERGILGLSGFKPVRHTILGGVDAADQAKIQSWLDEVRKLGGLAA